MLTTKRLWAATISAGLGLVALAGCSSTDEAWGPVTELNGEVPPGVMAPLFFETTMMDTIDADGQQLIVSRGVRKAGTRVGIHVHKYGGYTCVLSGTITDFVEGMAPQVHEAGNCYYMPSNTPMTAANLGDEDAVLIDNFRVPPGEDYITVIEPGWEDAYAAAVAADDEANAVEGDILGRWEGTNSGFENGTWKSVGVYYDITDVNGQTFTRVKSWQNPDGTWNTPETFQGAHHPDGSIYVADTDGVLLGTWNNDGIEATYLETSQDDQSALHTVLERG